MSINVNKGTPEVVVPATPPTFDILGVTAEEIQTLELILNRIGGSPEDSLRGYAGQFNRRLGEVMNKASYSSSYDLGKMVIPGSGITMGTDSKQNGIFLTRVRQIKDYYNR